MEALLGRMVTAPSATSSSSATGELFAPQLSEPTNRKWPVRLARFAASRTLLQGRRHWGHRSARFCPREPRLWFLFLLNVVLVGKDDDASGVARLH